MDGYANSVDKSGAPVGEREKTRPIQAIQNRRKNLLRPLPGSVRLDCHIALNQLQFLEGPLRRVFFFLGHWISFRQSLTQTTRTRSRIDPHRVCLILRHTASTIQLAGDFFRIAQPHRKTPPPADAGYVSRSAETLSAVPDGMCRVLASAPVRSRSVRMAGPLRRFRASGSL